MTFDSDENADRCVTAPTGSEVEHAFLACQLDKNHAGTHLFLPELSLEPLPKFDAESMSVE